MDNVHVEILQRVRVMWRGMFRTVRLALPWTPVQDMAMDEALSHTVLP